jgi:hypothetical protein
MEGSPHLRFRGSIIHVSATRIGKHHHLGAMLQTLRNVDASGVGRGG